MKLAVPNLKTLDYKQLGIDHGEKLAIAIIGLLLVFVLWSTKWSKPIAESPTELIEQANSTDEQIKKQPWPESEAKLLKTGMDLNGRTTSLLTPLELSPWVLPIPLNKPYHPDRTLIKKPKWLAVKDLIADAQAVDIEMDPKIARLNEGFRKLKKEEPPKQDKAKKGDKKDNRPEMLELATYAEQVKHAREILKRGCLDQKGEANNNAKLSDLACAEIRRRRTAGEPLKSIAKDFLISDRTVSKIALGQRRELVG